MTVLLVVSTASAHYELWNELFEQVVSLYKAGRTEEAATAAGQALTAAENRFGPGHPYVAVSLSILAQLYFEKGEYAKAEPLYTRALDIYKTSFGSESLGVAQTLTNMAALYLKMDRLEESFNCLTEAQRIYGVLCKTKLGEGQRQEEIQDQRSVIPDSTLRE